MGGLFLATFAIGTFAYIGLCWDNNPPPPQCQTQNIVIVVNTVQAGPTEIVPPAPTRPTPTPPVRTGMGAVIPPGGAGCGNAPTAPKSTSSNKVQAASVGDQDPSRVVIKVFVNGLSVPFSGITDASGYFFIPTIPAGRRSPRSLWTPKPATAGSMKGPALR